MVNALLRTVPGKLSDDAVMTFDVGSCLAAAKGDRLEDWIHLYLQGGPWANPGLSAGLRRQTRHWVGPVLMRLGDLERCCGPETDMEYRVEVESWRRKMSGMASRLADPMQVPPLIVQWRTGRLSVRDGNHRHAAACLAGWVACWAVVWYDDPAYGDAVRQAVVEATCRAPCSGGTAAPGTTPPHNVAR